MRHSFVAAAAVLTALSSSGLTSATIEGRGPYSETCDRISAAISNASAVHWPSLNPEEYKEDLSHYAASSEDASECSVRPGSAEDVGKILQILGSTKTPFAVKGGGHSQNPGFSSTPGVHIAMSRFNDVVYDKATQTAEVGAGLIWDDVYAALEPFGVSVVGGRVSGVGVAGFTLGGGYSWKTNQFGLTVDNVAAYELVLPDGNITTVTENSDAELFFGLKGGYNNFGIVTKFTLKTHVQTEVWGGVIVVPGAGLSALNAAVTKFSRTVTDPKAAILPSYNTVQGAPSASVIIFYDGPTPPSGIFDDLLALPMDAKDISTRSFLSLVQATPTSELAGSRGTFHTVPILDYSPALLDAVLNESTFWAAALAPSSVFFLSYDIEPFLPSILSHAPDASSAYPPARAVGFSPLNIYFVWADSASDDAVRAAVVRSADQLARVAESDGQRVEGAPLYGNYAVLGTPVARVFGEGEARERLRALKARVDPEGVMGLAGGWKIE